MNGELDKKNLCLAVSMFLLVVQMVTGSNNLFLLLAIASSWFYLCKISTEKINRILSGVVSFGYMAIFLLYFTSGVLIMFA